MPTPTRDELINAIPAAMRVLGVRSRLFDQAMASQMGINETDLLCLDLMDVEEPEMTASRLAELTGLSSGAITGVIDRLERAGLVTREADSADRRRVIVRLRPDTGQRLSSLLAPLAAGEAELCQGYTAEQLDAILDHARQAASLLEELTAEMRHAARSDDAGEAESGDLWAPLGSTTAGVLRFTAGASLVTLSGGADPHELYRGRFKRILPEIRVKGGTVTVVAGRSRFGFRRIEGRLDLNPTIPWDIELRGGASRLSADLTDLDVRSVLVSGGASHALLHLPRPRGEVTVQLSGGASHVEMDRPAGVAVRARVRAGSSRFTFDDERFGGVGVNNRWETPDFRDATDRYVIEVSGGASDVAVRTRPD